MKGIRTEILSRKGKNSTPSFIFLDLFLRKTWLFYHSRYCRSVTHLYISISSSFLNVEFVKSLFSTFCLFHFPYLSLLETILNGRDSIHINSTLSVQLLQVLQTSPVSGHFGLCVPPASGVQSVTSVVIAFLPLVLCQRATLSGNTLNWGPLGSICVIKICSGAQFVVTGFSRM